MQQTVSGGIWIQTSRVRLAPEAGAFTTTPSLGISQVILDSSTMFLLFGSHSRFPSLP